MKSASRCRTLAWAGVASAVILPLQLTALEPSAALLRNWPQWRGPLATGVAPQATPPIRWSETENVRWKVEVPGRGTASPIVWGDRLFLLTAVESGDASAGVAQPRQFKVLAYDKTTGRIAWERTVREQVPHSGHHRDHGYASASAITDGEVLIAHFGSYGTYALDLNGQLLWEKDLGDMKTRNDFGEGSSPALYGNTVVVLWDHEGEDFIVGLDRKTGQERWRTGRDEPTGWCTPLVVASQGKPQVVVNGTQRVRSYDLATGKVLWECGGQTANAVPTAVALDDRVLVTSGFRGSALQAIRLDRTGDLTGTDAVLWSYNRHTPYVPSPLLYGDLLYLFAGNEATLSVCNARTGERHIDAARLEGIRGVYASATGAADRVYLVGRDGGTLVLRKGASLDILAKNRLDDAFDASPALVGADLFLRGRRNLYCLAQAMGSDLNL